MRDDLDNELRRLALASDTLRKLVSDGLTKARIQEALLRAAASKTEVIWTITGRDDSRRPIGFASLFGIDLQFGSSGYRPFISAGGPIEAGLIGEAVDSVVAYATEKLHLRRLIAIVPRDQEIANALQNHGFETTSTEQAFGLSPPTSCIWTLRIQ